MIMILIVMYTFDIFATINQVQDGGKYCDICEILMGIIDTQVTMNKSSQEINATIFTICHLFSRDVMIVVSDVIRNAFVLLSGSDV